MNLRSLLPSVVALLVGSSVACGGATAGSTSDPEHQPSPSPSPDPSPAPLPEPNDDPTTWPESIRSTSPWPEFGSGVPGVLTAPTWVAPTTLGCEVHQRVRTQPDKGLQPGDAPRVVVEATLDTTCRPAGSRVTVVDEPSYPDARIFEGSCAEGFALATLAGKLATVAFDSPESCERFAAARAGAKAGTTDRRIATTLRLDALTPTAAFTVIGFGEASDSAGFAFLDAP